MLSNQIPDVLTFVFSLAHMVTLLQTEISKSLKGFGISSYFLVDMVMRVPQRSRFYSECHCYYTYM